MNIHQRHIVPTRRNATPQNSTTVIILAANIGYGMKSYGPKSLLSINPHETLIEYQLNLIQSLFPQSDIILVVGFAADKIIKRCPPGIRIVENQFFESTNEVEQVRLALNCTVTHNVLIIKDDIVFNNQTLCEVSKNNSCLIYDSKNQIDDFNIGVTVVDGKANYFSYEISDKWCHIVYLTKKEVDLLRNICSKRDRSKMYLHEALNILLHKVGSIRAIEPTKMEIVKIDTSRHLTQLQE